MFNPQSSDIINQTPIEHIALSYKHPETGCLWFFIPHKAVIGTVNPDTIPTDPQVYDPETGYISIGVGEDHLILKLQEREIKLIESILEKKDEAERSTRSFSL